MNVLAIDTSSMVATAAVMDEEKVLCEYILNHKKTHSQKLMPIVEQVLISCEMEIKDIDIFSVVIGPGSFTGLRIGVATVKALAHANNKPILGISTLDALAFNIPYYEGIICPIIDARNNQVYTALYKWKSTSIERISEYIAVDITEIIGQLKQKNENVIFLGDGMHLHMQTLKNNLGDLADFSPVYSSRQRASLAAELALKRYFLGEHDDYMTLSPLYLRKSQAERLREKSNSCG